MVDAGSVRSIVAMATAQKVAAQSDLGKGDMRCYQGEPRKGIGRDVH